VGFAKDIVPIQKEIPVGVLVFAVIHV